MEETAVNTTLVSQKSSPLLIFMLAAIAVLSVAFVWSGAGKMLRMRTQAASHAELAQLKSGDEAKVVVEITEANAGKIRGKLLERRDETHYSRTVNVAEVSWNQDTKLVMGKAEDVHVGAVVHVTGKVGADRGVQASQIVILTGYVQVK
jgi:hypothetical protein